MAQQLSLFTEDDRFLVDEPTGRIAYYPAALTPDQAERLFATLLNEARWSSETMWMYDHMVDVPRLVARYRTSDPDVPLPLRAALEQVQTVLGERFNSIGLNYYRDESDSVAWHSDHIEELVPLPTIALLSLGSTRRMQLRTKKRPRRTFSIDLDPGSLLVMSGRAQDFWEHTIPKLAQRSSPRISAAFRLQRET